MLAASSSQDKPPENDAEEVAPSAIEEAGIDAVAWWYEFASSSGTYTEILTGTVHGNASNDDASFNAIDLGFTFNFDGVDYTQVSIQSNGFIAMGPTVSSSYTPLSTGSSNNVVAALGRDIEGNDTTSTLMSKVEGTAPNRVFIIQWSHYRRYGSTYTGDDFNFQIRLYETSNKVELVYGSFAFHDTTTLYVQVGLRGASNADFNNRTTTTDWAASTAGLTNADTMSLSSVVYPASGLTYDWTIASGLFLHPESQNGQVCKGSDVLYDVTLANLTGVDTAFDLTYTSVWPYVGPATSPVLADGETWDFQVSVHIPWSANPGDSDVLTLTAAGGGETDTATMTTSAGVLAGWTDYANAPRPVRAPSIVYHDGKLYKIGGYDGAAQAYLDIYDIATDTWTAGADMPGARYWLNCEAIDLTGTDPKIYCAGGYLSAGQATLYIYDINTNAWSTGTDMSAYRYDYASAVLNNKYYVIGGYGAGYTNTIWEYDPATNTWNYSLPGMVQGRRYAAAGVIGGKIYVAGGYKSPSPYYLDSVEIYDPVANSWSAGPTMPTTWLTAADGVKHDRYLILAGGDDNSYSAASNVVWVLDTVTGMWSRGPDMDHALYSAEGDSDGSNFWVVSGRLYDGAYSYSPYTTLLDQCDETCTPVSGADFTWDPTQPWANYVVTFDASVTAGSLPIYFDWTFGDGGTGMGQTVEHTYLLTDTYPVGLVATNCDGASTDTASHDVTVILPPTISVDPTSLHATQPISTVTTQTLEICNLGDAPLTWELTEAEAGLLDVKPHPAPVTQPTPQPEIMRLPDGSVDCAAYENYAGFEPLEVGEVCGSNLLTPTSLEANPLGPTDIGYALEMYSTDNIVSFTLNNFPGQTVVGPMPTPLYGMDFDQAAEVLWALNDTTDQLGTIDLATGAFTGLVPCAPPVDIWTGLSIDPVTGEFYASDATGLYTINPATGASTYIGAFGPTLMIDIAINMDGEMYGHDIGTDSIYSIDMSTGAATLIGPTGYAGNYAQGMDFDNDDGTLYIFLYTGGGTNVYGTVDLMTGAVTPLSQNNPLGEFEGAIQIPGIAYDIPWVSEDPITGTIPGSSCSLLDVVFDSNVVGAGEYYGLLEIESNDPVTPMTTVPVTLTVGNPPDIEVTMPVLDVELSPDATLTLDGTICNVGDIPLNWAIQEAPSVLDGSMAFVPVNVEGPTDAPDGISPSNISTQLVPPMSPPDPDAVLWDQPLSSVNQNAYVNQEFGDYPTYSSFLADDFTNPEAWEISSIFVPGNGWNGFTTLMNATALTWQIYADNAGVPDGDPSGGGNPPVWTFSLPPTDSQVVITNGSGGLPSNVQLNLTSPMVLPPGTWWLVFYPTMDLSTGGQFGRQPADTTNGYDGQFINPGGAFGFGTTWQNWSIIGPTQQDIAFRLEGEVAVLDIPWLSEDPISGTLPGGECIDEYVTFDSTGLEFGVYTGDLVITSDDPDEPEITLPVTLTVNPVVDFVYYDLEDVVLEDEAVYLAGEFNGWMADATPMTPNDDFSVFTATVLLAPDTYEYKYVVYTDTVPTGPAHWDWLQSYPDGSNRSVVVADSMMVEDYRDIVPGYWELWSPDAITVTVGITTEDIHGRIWAPGFTMEGVEPRGLLAELGFGTDEDPAAWTTWAAMTWDSQVGNDADHVGNITPTEVGMFSYAVRYNANWGVGNPNNLWYYADTYWDEIYNPDDAGVLTVLDEMADLSVTKHGQAMVETGENITYTLTVENAGPFAAVNVVLVDTLPEGVTFVSATTPCEELEGVVTCDLGDMAMDGMMVIHIVVTAPETAGMLTNDVMVSSDTVDPDETNNSASFDTEVVMGVFYRYLPMTFKH